LNAVCAELEADCIGKGSEGGEGGGGTADLSRITAALTLVHVIATTSCLLQVLATLSQTELVV